MGGERGNRRKGTDQARGWAPMPWSTCEASRGLGGWAQGRKKVPGGSPDLHCAPASLGQELDGGS